MTLTHEQQRQYEELVTAIVKAVPGIKEHVAVNLFDQYRCSFCNKRWPLSLPLGEKCPVGRPITLEDVLRSLQKSKSFKEVLAVTLLGQFVFIDNGTLAVRLALYNWHPGRDLAWHRDNAPETITFLHSLRVP